jgi:hypothetical protein
MWIAGGKPDSGRNHRPHIIQLLLGIGEQLRDLAEGDSSMSFMTAEPEMLAATAAQLQGVGAALAGGNAAAAAPTTGVVPAAADAVSALTAAQFAIHAQMYQAVSAQATAVHQAFVAVLHASARSYAATEAANAIAAG